MADHAFDTWFETSAAEIYKATDPSYANCLICSVNPTRRCPICDDRMCEIHTCRDLDRICPLCYAIDLVYQRKKIVNIVGQLAGMLPRKPLT